MSAVSRNDRPRERLRCAVFGVQDGDGEDKDTRDDEEGRSIVCPASREGREELSYCEVKKALKRNSTHCSCFISPFLPLALFEWSHLYVDCDTMGLCTSREKPAAPPSVPGRKKTSGGL